MAWNKCESGFCKEFILLNFGLGFVKWLCDKDFVFKSSIQLGAGPYSGWKERGREREEGSLISHLSPTAVLGSLAKKGPCQPLSICILSGLGPREAEYT